MKLFFVINPEGLLSVSETFREKFSYCQKNFNPMKILNIFGNLENLYHYQLFIKIFNFYM